MPYSAEIAKIEMPNLAELFEIAAGQNVYRYTSYIEDITFQSFLYSAVAIKRSSFSFDSSVGAAKIQITAQGAAPFLSFISNAPIERPTVKITRVILSDLSLFKKIFDGEVVKTSVSQGVITAECESANTVFNKKLPVWTYQADCNNALFDSECALIKVLFETAAVISVSGSNLVSATFATKPSGYFTAGHVVTAYGDARLITDHVTSTIRLNVPFDGRLGTGATVKAYPGCDKKAATCVSKFNNLTNFKGFPYIPSNNPVVWGFDK